MQPNITNKFNLDRSLMVSTLGLVCQMTFFKRQLLFERLCHKPKLMPGYFQRFIPEQGLQRTIADYIAGMTDRYASKTLNEA